MAFLGAAEYIGDVTCPRQRVKIEAENDVDRKGLVPVGDVANRKVVDDQVIDDEKGYATPPVDDKGGETVSDTPPGHAGTNRKGRRKKKRGIFGRNA